MEYCSLLILGSRRIRRAPGVRAAQVTHDDQAALEDQGQLPLRLRATQVRASGPHGEC